MRRIHSIVLHHTAGPETATVESIRRKHLLRKWRDIGYHWVVRWNGDKWVTERGRDAEKQGAHAGRGFAGNLGTLGLVLAGHYVTTQPSAMAVLEVEDTLLRLQIEIGHKLYLFGHCDLNATACPGSKLYDHIPLLRAAMRDNRSNGIETYQCVPLGRRLAEDRAEARMLFNALKPWAKGRTNDRGGF